MRLIELEPGQRTMPTAVFYAADGGLHEQPQCEFGRAAVSAYVDGIDGRLMRSMKSILGSSLIEQTTDIGGGRAVRYLDVVATYLAHLRRRAEAEAGFAIGRAVLGRPVFFVDDDPARDAQAERALRRAAQRAGFREVEFQYEPIAAAFDYEQAVRGEEKVLVADIGGGTSDFSIVRVGPGRARQAERKADILANHGVHVAGTDFDRRVELASVLPLLGYRAFGIATRRPAGARGAERGLFRPRDLAPDQHRLQPAAGRRAARHALVLCRSGASPAADERRRPAPRPRPARPRRGRQDHGRRRRRDDDRRSNRSKRVWARASTRRAPAPRSTPISTGSSPPRARPRPRPASARARSTRSISPAAPRACAC